MSLIYKPVEIKPEGKDWVPGLGITTYLSKVIRECREHPGKQFTFPIIHPIYQSASILAASYGIIQAADKLV